MQRGHCSFCRQECVSFYHLLNEPKALVCPLCFKCREDLPKDNMEKIQVSHFHIKNMDEFRKCIDFDVSKGLTINNVPPEVIKLGEDELNNINAQIRCPESKSDYMMEQFGEAFVKKMDDKLSPRDVEGHPTKVYRALKSGTTLRNTYAYRDNYLKGDCSMLESVSVFGTVLHTLGELCQWSSANLWTSTMFFFSGLVNKKNPKKRGELGTGFHKDITRGANVAFAVEPENAGSKILARWLFIKPTISALLKVHAYLTSCGEKDTGMQELQDAWVKSGGFNPIPSFSGDGRTLHADADDMSKYALPIILSKEMDVIAAALPDDVLIVDQHHGEVVLVPPGWVHAVVNVEENWKLARDYAHRSEIPIYAFYHALIGVRMGQRMASDYFSLDSRCKHVLAKIVAGIDPDREFY